MSILYIYIYIYLQYIYIYIYSQHVARSMNALGTLLASSFNGIAVADDLDEQGNMGKTNPLKILLQCSARITRSTKRAERTPLVFPFNARAPVPITDAIARANSC